MEKKIYEILSDSRRGTVSEDESENGITNPSVKVDETRFTFNSESKIITEENTKEGEVFSDSLDEFKDTKQKIAIQRLTKGKNTFRICFCDSKLIFLEIIDFFAFIEH